jgi:hypothetical protein
MSLHERHGNAAYAAFKGFDDARRSGMTDNKKARPLGPGF